MAAVTSAIIGAIGVGLSAVGTFEQMQGSKKAAQASERAEELRKKQMNLDSARERRNIIRQAIIARSNSLAAGVASGAQNSSAMGGAYGQITGEMNRGLTFNQQSTSIGAGIFDQNAAMARAQGQQGLGQGMTAFGSMMIDNAQKFERLGNYYTGRNANGYN